MNYGYAEVQEGMIGWKIDMRLYTGYEDVYAIRAEDLDSQPFKIFLPVVKDNVLEIRTCWAVPVRYQGAGFEGWVAYIDIEYGNLVKLATIEEQLD